MQVGVAEDRVLTTLTEPVASLAAIGPRLRALVLLAGSVRPGELGRTVHRSLLDLPLDSGATVLSMWHNAAEALALAAGVGVLPVRIAVDRATPPPTVPNGGERVQIHLDTDPSDFRGTGGILHDLCRRHSYSPDDLLLVAHAAQILLRPLPQLAGELAGARAAVSLIGHQDRTPVGLFLVKCSALTGAAGVGFLDFKEQLLPKLSAGARHNVRVIMHDRATALPIRTRDGYISGLRAHHRHKHGAGEAGEALVEDWFPTFAIQEPGSTVDASATIHDSVVLKGARVERSAVVVRSVVGPGGAVYAGQTVTDQVIGDPDRAPRGSP